MICPCSKTWNSNLNSWRRGRKRAFWRAFSHATNHDIWDRLCNDFFDYRTHYTPSSSQCVGKVDGREKTRLWIISSIMWEPFFSHVPTSFFAWRWPISFSHFKLQWARKYINPRRYPTFLKNWFLLTIFIMRCSVTNGQNTGVFRWYWWKCDRTN